MTTTELLTVSLEDALEILKAQDHPIDHYPTRLCTYSAVEAPQIGDAACAFEGMDHA